MDSDLSDLMTEIGATRYQLNQLTISVTEGNQAHGRTHIR